MLRRISLVTQLGLTLVTPAVLLVLGAVWLREKANIGEWIFLVAILVGILSGICGVYSLIRAEITADTRVRTDRTNTGDKHDKT